MTGGSSTGELHCGRCGAALTLGSTKCWLCQAAVESSAVSHTAAGPGMLPERLGTYSLASLMMFVTLVSIVLGVSTIAPGVGIPLGIILLVVWLRTAAVARQRAARGLAVTRAERTQLFLASFGATLALIAVTCVAGCAAYFAACFACMGTWAGLEGLIGEYDAEAFAYIVYAVVALAIAIPTLWWLTKTIRRRWRRDIGEDVPVDPMHRRLWFIVLFIVLAFLVGWLLFATFGVW